MEKFEGKRRPLPARKRGRGYGASDYCPAVEELPLDSARSLYMARKQLTPVNSRAVPALLSLERGSRLSVRRRSSWTEACIRLRLVPELSVAAFASACL
jgi:hypothetical protein